MGDKVPWARLTAAMVAYTTGEFMKPDYSCHCTVLDHDHPWGSQCERRGTYAGGVCTECRYFHTFPERRENLA